MVRHIETVIINVMYMCLQLHVNASEKEARKGSRRKNCNCTYSDSSIYTFFFNQKAPWWKGGRDLSGKHGNVHDVL